MRRVQAQSASVDTQFRQRPRGARPCQQLALPPLLRAELLRSWTLTAVLLLGCSCHRPCLCFHPREAKLWPTVSAVSLFCPPGHRKRECHRGKRGTLPPAELGPVSKGGERLTQEQPEPHYPLRCLSPDSQWDSDPTTSARKDYESLH